ncbi:MAG: Gldg family protein [Chitinophagaceae bacterium]|nr:Gldg family protein [Chitinophagaceae bacterium]
MKIILKIARTELQKLFYSPVAWLILVIFTFQAALSFTAFVGNTVYAQAMHFNVNSLTYSFYAQNYFGLFRNILSYLYLYTPLLTMGLMSRELSTGSINLLYSSPITNSQIVLGKYLSVMIFGLVLMAVIFVFVAFGIITIDHVETPLLLCGLLGIYLLICAYAAIGLFVSTLTPYMVVAAMGTLGIFALLTYVKGMWQDVEIVRDITYWLALSGRVDTFIKGMITSEDLLYFVIVVLLFLSLTILRLQSGRQKTKWIISWGKFLAAFLLAVLLGYLSAMPKLKGYIDVTRSKMNTLTVSSQKVVSKIPDNVTITTYTNMLFPDYFLTVPGQYKADMENFQDYLRFNPTIKTKYVYFYHKVDNPFLEQQYPHLNEQQIFDTLKRISEWDYKIVPYGDIAGKVDLSGEGFRSVRVVETPDGKKTFLRFFDDATKVAMESEISAAFKHLVDRLPTVGFLTGHGERSTDDASDRGYNMFTQDKTFRYALINQGFDFEEISLNKPVPEKIRILVIAEMKSMLTPAEQQNLQDYIDRGGNMLIMGEPGRQPFMNSITGSLGIRFLPGTLMHEPGKLHPTLIPLVPTTEGKKLSWVLDDISRNNRLLTMPTAAALEVTPAGRFNATTWCTTLPDSCWSELETTNFIDDTAIFHPVAGEVKRAYPTVVSLHRNVGDRQQKIIVTGDADWLSAGELNMQRKGIFSANYSLIFGVFSWLSDDEVPIDMRHPDPIDNSFRMGQGGWKVVGPLLRWVFPGALILLAIIIWIRRKGR